MRFPLRPSSSAGWRLLYARKTRLGNAPTALAQIVRMNASRPVNKQMPAAKAASKEQAADIETAQPFENDGGFFRNAAQIIVVHNGIGFA
jgi:hypothetical protein